MTSKLTRERLAEIAQFGFSSAITPANDFEIKGLARMALAAMDREPYGFTDGDRRGMIYEPQYADRLNEPLPVYLHAQPVVPDGLVKAVEFYEQVKRENPPVETGAWKDAVDLVLKEAYRAAMLQELKKSAGTEATCRSNENAQVLTSINPTPALVSLPKNAKSLTGNSPAIPDGYVMVPVEPTDEMLAAAKEWTGLTSTAEVVYIKMIEAAPHEVKGE